MMMFSPPVDCTLLGSPRIWNSVKLDLVGMLGGRGTNGSGRKFGGMRFLFKAN